MPTPNEARDIALTAAEEWAHFHDILGYTTAEFTATFKPRYQRESMLLLFRNQLGEHHPAYQSYRAAFLAEAAVARDIYGHAGRPRAA